VVNPQASLDIPSPSTVPAASGFVLRLLAGFAIAACYLLTLGHAPLIEPDEPRYAEIAREMVESGDWVTPHLNYVKYFEKPPLLYWLTAANLATFGADEFWLRLWPALLALAGIGAAAWLGQRIYGPPVGFLTALVLASAPLYFGIGQVLILDMPLTGFLTLAMLCGWLIAATPQRRPWAELGFALAVALAVLTKGPVGAVLAGGSLLTFAALSRRWLWWATLLRPFPVLVFLAVSVPWFVVVSLRNPEFAHFFFIDQHLGRYLAPSEHQQPIWFFVPILFAGFLPWSAVALVGLWRQRWAEAPAVVQWSHGTLYFLSWVLFPAVFFSLSGSKLATYILPVFPPLAVLLGRWLHELTAREDERAFGTGGLLLGTLGIGSLAASRLAPLVSTHPRAALLGPYLVAGGVVLLLGGFAAWRCVQRARLWQAVFAIWAATMALCLVVFAGRGLAQHYTPLALAIRAHWQPGDRVVLLGHYVQGIPFYTRQRAILVRSWGELDFGSRQGDQRAFFWRDEDQLLRAWREPQRMFLVLNRSELLRLAAALDPAPREIARFGKKAVVVNFP